MKIILKSYYFLLFLTVFNLKSQEFLFQDVKNYRGSCVWCLAKPFLETISKATESNIFFETGTCQGDSALVASEVFNTVYTVELDKELYKYSVEKLSNKDNVKVLFGDSPSVMAAILSKLKNKGRIVFWLDAHWSDGNTAKGDKVTPVLEEINTIKNSGLKDSIILIDDLRMFQDKKIQNLVEEKYPSAVGYPSLREVCDAILKINSHYKFMVLGDVLMAYPDKINIGFSSVVQAMTASRFFEDYPELMDLKEQDLIKMELDLAHSPYISERKALQQIYDLFKEPEIFCRHYKLWYGITLIGNRKYLDAKEYFKGMDKSYFNRLKKYSYFCNLYTILFEN